MSHRPDNLAFAGNAGSLLSRLRNVRGDMMPPDKRMADFYVDETVLSVNGRRCLLYGIAIPSRLEDATSHVFDLKYQLGLDPSLEIRWRLVGIPPELKPPTKEGTLDALARHFSCLVSVVGTDDKDAAFQTVLDHIKLYSAEHGVLFANIFYDQDCFHTHSRVVSALVDWDSVRCTALGRMDSRFSVGIQLADILAGTFRYIVEAAFGKPARRIRVLDEGLQRQVEYGLDDFFGVMLRYNFWGEHPPYLPSEEDTTVEHMTADAFERGVLVRGEFTDAELATFHELARFYRGCMH